MESETKKLSKGEKLDELLELIEQGRTGSASMLAARFGVADRTIYWLLEILKDCGHPIRYDRKRKTYFLKEEKGVGGKNINV